MKEAMLKIAFAPEYVYPLPEGHRFPMAKYALLPEQLLYEGTVEPENFFDPAPLSEQHLLWTHDNGYWDKLKHQTISYKESRAIGFPMSERLVQRSLRIAQGTIDCALYAQQYGVAMNIAGGTHHAFADHGEGFCLLNDIAIASNYLLRKELAKKILIVDLDVHQGNGTAHIFREEPRVFTFSMHAAKNYPMQKEVSDLDIGLPDGCTDTPFLRILQEVLPRLLDAVQPDMVFYLSGVDVLETDRLGRLGLSMEGCKNRDRLVLELCRRHRVPVAVSMGGGYSSRIAHIIEAHANTYRMAQFIFF